MLSESYPPLSLPMHQERRAAAAARTSMPELSRSLSKLAARRGGWAALALVLLTGWAAWSAACWLLERWQLH
jgi:hypothetical protein